MERQCCRSVRRKLLAATRVVGAGVFLAATAAPAFGRVFGLDTSSATGRATPPTLLQWQNSYNDADGDGRRYEFAWVRSSRGGTADATRLDDTEFYDNISTATTAGLLVGSYHYTRPDVTTHTAADDAAHYLERAGMYMKPGYLLPVFDLEAGNTARTTAEMTTWALEFINTIYSAKGILPITYTNSSYNNDEVGAEAAWFNFATTPKTSPRTYQWVARPSGNLATGDPGAATNYPNPYGVWDPNFISRTNSRNPAVKPWAFWQNGSGSPNGFLIDYNAANGNIEYVKDFLVPALWTTAGNGDWNTIANWNSDNPTYNGTIQSGPAPRLPNNQNLDWVKLQNTGGWTVTISSGAQTVRKIYTQQPLNITGGSLTVGYIPGAGGQFDVPAEFAAAVTLSGAAGYTAHTTQVNGGSGTFNVNGGSLTFTEIRLASHASNPGRLIMGGDATFAPTGGAGTAVIRSTGSLAEAGNISLSAGNRTMTVSDGSANVDLYIPASITGTGRLVKAGAGTMQLSGAKLYTGGTTITGGVLQIAGDSRLGLVPGGVSSNNIALDGGTLRTGAEIASTALGSPGSGYTSFPTLTIGGAGADVRAASANVLAGVSTIAVTGGGTGYVNQTVAPAANTAGTFVDFVGGGGTGAAAFATVVGGVVTGVTVTNAGTGYTSKPTIWISSTAISGVAGTGAAANVSGIALQSIALGDGGFDYNSPTIALTGGGGSGATASATPTSAITLAATRGVSLGSAGGTLYQTAGSTLTIAGVVSGPSGALTKSGAGTLVLNGANTYAGNTTINAGTLSVVNSGNLGASSNGIILNGGTLAAAGTLASGSRNVTVQAGNGTIDTATYSVTVGNVDGVGNLTKAGSGTLTANRFRVNNLTINAAMAKTLAVADPASSASVMPGVSKVNSLIVSGTGMVNLANNRFITNDVQGTESGGIYSGVQGLVQSGKIFTDQALAGSNQTAIGVATAAEAKGLVGAATTLWSGQAIDSNDTLVMYTWAGDANLDGKVNADDYASIDLYSTVPGADTWNHGDFNYNGVINADDYALIDNNVQNINYVPYWTTDAVRGFAAESSGLTAVPEPALGLAGIALLPLMRRRRR
jgi:autotransporter-associated beta strand protein